jgi:putative nucleotidyltransferase with HDIG domain
MSGTTTVPQNSKAWRSVRLDVIERVEALPSLSSVVLEFLELTKKEVFSARDFESVISKDQSLVARLLKVANCGLYGRSRSVGTIPEAVVLIGLENMTKIVFAVSAAGLIRQDLRSYHHVAPNGFWLHVMGVALVARSLAEAGSRSALRGDEAFVAGLLHDVGKLIIDEFLPSANGARVVTSDEEVAAVGLDHAELGALILDQWGLPEPIVTAVRVHHGAAEDDDSRGFAAPIQLAQALCDAWRVGQENPMDLSEDVDLSEHGELLRVLGIPSERVPQLIWDVRQNLVGLEERFPVAG